MPWRRLWVREGGRAVCGGDLHRDVHAFYILAFFFLPLTAPCRVYPLRKLNYICKNGEMDFQGLCAPPSPVYGGKLWEQKVVGFLWLPWGDEALCVSPLPL